ncbi:MAG: hypothetical protein ACYDA3_03155 [Gaiellaceae bacterium]
MSSNGKLLLITGDGCHFCSRARKLLCRRDELDRVIDEREHDESSKRTTVGAQ